MLNRFCRIYSEFGAKAAVKVAVLIIGLVGMAVGGVIGFGSPWAAVISAVGLVLGFLLRRAIAKGIEAYSRVFQVGVFVYGIVLFIGERLGWEMETKLLIITATTAVVFNLQFWSLSDCSVVNTEHSTQE